MVETGSFGWEDHNEIALKLWAKKLENFEIGAGSVIRHHWRHQLHKAQRFHQRVCPSLLFFPSCYLWLVKEHTVARDRLHLKLGVQKDCQWLILWRHLDHKQRRLQLSESLSHPNPHKHDAWRSIFYSACRNLRGGQERVAFMTSPKGHRKKTQLSLFCQVLADLSMSCARLEQRNRWVAQWPLASVCSFFLLGNTQRQHFNS